MFGVTAKGTPLLATLATVTTTLPLVAALGTVATMEDALQVVTLAAVPLKVTAPAEPKLEPEIVTDAPTIPEAGDKPVIAGAGFPDPVVPLAYTEAGQFCQVAEAVHVAGNAFSPVWLPALLQAVPSSRKRTMLPLTPSKAIQYFTPAVTFTGADRVTVFQLPPAVVAMLPEPSRAPGAPLLSA